MPTNYLNDNQKASIRAITEEAIAAGKSTAELSWLRKELAQDFGVSLRSIGSVGAYVQYSATEALNDCDLVGQLSNKDLILVSRLCRNSPTSSRDLELLSSRMGISAKALAAVVHRYEEYLAGRPGGLPSVTQQDTSEKNLTDTSTPIRENAITVPKHPSNITEPIGAPLALRTSRGDVVDYDFKDKRDWREYWTKFIDDNLPQSSREVAKVICLPGRKVEPEVSHYLKLGIKPENIYAVEGSPRVRDEFVHNASRLKIKYFTQPLQKILAQIDVRFDVVNYDFHGQHCMAHRRALQQTPITDDAIIVYNALGKRESKEMQTILKATAASGKERREFLNDYEKALSDNHHPEMPLVRRLKGLGPAKGISSGRDSETNELKKLRTTTIPDYVRIDFGKRSRSIHRDLIVSILPFTHREVDFSRINDASNEILSDVLVSHSCGRVRIGAPLAVVRLLWLLKENYAADIFHSIDGAALGLVVSHTILSLPYEKQNTGVVYQYDSEVNQDGAKAKFFSTITRFITPQSISKEIMPSIRFCAVWLSIYGNFFSEHVSKFRKYIEITDKRNHIKEYGDRLNWDDMLHLYKANSIVSSIQIGELRQALVYSSRLEKSPHNFTL